MRFAILALLLSVVPAAAQEPPELPPFDEGDFTAFTFWLENDVVQLPTIQDEDRNYTGGFGFQFSGGFVHDAHLDAPLRGLDRLTRFSRKHDDPEFDQHYHSLLIFGTAFTPDNLNTSRPVRNDRPYGSLIGASVRRLSVHGGDQDQAWSSELAIAVLGLPVARNVQTWIHRQLRARSGEETPYDPLGWRNQISDGGEPTALYRVSYERLLLGKTGSNNRKHFQVSGGLGASVGYYTNVNAATNARLGWFNSDFWQFTPGAMSVGAQAGSGSIPQWELFAFGGVRPRLNFYNALLQGQFRESTHTVDINHGTLEWDLGVAAYIPKIRTQVMWNALAGRTSEFEGGIPRTHTWGSIAVTYRPR